MSKKQISRELFFGIVIVTVIIAGVVFYIWKKEKEKSKEHDLQKRIDGDEELPEQIKSQIESEIRNSDGKSDKTIISSFSEAKERIVFLKQIIEKRDGHKLFYSKSKPYQPIVHEKELHILYDLTWYDTKFDVNKEVNNGRGAVDFKISNGSIDKSLVEFKLASNPKLKKNLQNQVEIYKEANQTKQSLTVILFMSESEEEKANRIINELCICKTENIILIDARIDNKPSASVA